MRRRAHLAALALLAAGLVGAAWDPAASASLDEGSVIPGVYGIADMVADEVHGRIFISQGTDSSSITVIDQNGAVVGAVPDVADVRDMALSPDSSVLYAIGSGNRMLAVDTVALQVVETYELCADICASRLAVAGGFVWFSWGDYNQGEIAALDPASGIVTRHVRDTDSAVWLYSSPARPGELFGWAFWAYGDQFQPILAFDVGTGLTPSLVDRASRDTSWAQIWTTDVEFDAGGQNMIVAAENNALILDPETLALKSVAPADGDLAEIAIRGDGLVAGSSPFEDGLQLFRLGSTKLFSAYPMNDVVDHGLAFLRDRLLVFTETEIGVPVRLHIIDPGEATKLSLDIVSRRAVAGTPLRVSVRGPAGRRVRFDTIERGETRHGLVTKEIPDTGLLKARVPLDHNGCIVATALKGAGQDASEPVRECVSVRAGFRNIMRAHRSKRGDVYVYRTSDVAVIQSRVLPADKKGRCVYFHVQVQRGSRWFSYAGSGCVRLDERSRARAGLSGRGLSGQKLRLRTQYVTDKHNRGNKSEWITIKFLP
jgi:hypothetical protein